MKRVIKSSEPEAETIYVVMYLDPIFYVNSEMLSSIKSENGKWISDNNPSGIINGPLSLPGEELETPVKEEYENFVKDCVFMIESSGFTIINQNTSTDSEKSKSVLIFGMKDYPCGRLVFELRISDHPLDKYTFPDNLKDEALEYLKINKVLDESATKAGINFQVAKVLVGSVKNDTWDSALNRLSSVLRTLNEVRSEKEQKL